MRETNTIRDQCFNRHIGIGDGNSGNVAMANEDPILAGKGISTGGSEYSFVVVADTVVEIIDANVNLVWVMGKYEKVKSARFIIENIQGIFLSEEVQSKDQLWKEHCAGDLRELTDNHYEASFQRFLKVVPKRGDSDTALELYKSISAHREFLNDFHHMRSGAIGKAKTLLGNPNLRSIEVSDFDKICTSFIFSLYKLFTFNKQK